ncbi:MAG: HAD-IA family hydrolase [Deltaproteobacteria bacterium]|nr:HAD-IA family hydrolase [Deltaproteobacteria bacterium]
MCHDAPAARGAVFDLDGTLADTIADIAWAMDTVLARHGCPPCATDDYRRFIGHGGRDLVTRALPADRQGLADAVLREFRGLYQDHLCDRTRPYPGVPELLDRLTERGVRLAVLSNKAEAGTREVVARLFAAWPFAAVLGEADDRPKKPDPTAALLIAERLGLPPARCVLVGDSASDVETARRAGMVGVGALWGYRGRADLEAAQPHALIAAPADLLGVLDGLD